MTSKLDAVVASLVIVLALVVAAVVVQACTSTQAGSTATGLRVAAGVVDIPGVNEAAIEEYLSGVERRFAELESRKGSGEKLGWSDWMFALIGGGGASAAATGALLKRNNTIRSRGRAELIEALVASLQDAEPDHDVVEKKLRRANLAPNEVNKVRDSLDALRRSRRDPKRSAA